jgi:hypothetical protein
MNQKETYITPTLDVEVIKIEQGIAQTSTGAPSVNGWDEQAGSTVNEDAS